MSGACILIVEDDADTRELMHDILVEEGYVVMTAKNGKEALAKLEYMTRPCLILLDMAMPIMSGAEFCRELRLRGLTQHVPVVLTAGVGEVRCAEAREVLRKPVSLDALLRAIHQHCPLA